MRREAVEAQESIYLEAEKDLVDSFVGVKGTDEEAIKKANAAYGY